jgi:RNase adapter protein RapZ
VQLILVSGLSGAGKSIALHVLEDGGFYCVDNLPAGSLDPVLGYLAEAGHERVAVSVDARSAALAALPEQIARLRSRGVDVRVLYLEATTAALLRRFSETRRRHPLASSGAALQEAIEQERSLLAGVAPLGHRIDTSELLPRVLQNWIRDLLGIGANALTLLFESFAYRDGIPLDADWVLDARMLPNPHYEPQLRPLTGRDDAVIEYLRADPAAGRWLEDVRGLLARWLPEIVKENRSYVTVAIGCTGGRHRSVYLVEQLAEAFRKEWNVLVRHRGLARAAPE